MAELTNQRPDGQEWPEDSSGTAQARVAWPVAKPEEASLRTEVEKMSDRKGWVNRNKTALSCRMNTKASSQLLRDVSQRRAD